MELDSASTLSLTAFTVYPITLTPMKTCYESEACKIICSISGPYYERTANIEPVFQIKIVSNNNETSNNDSGYTQVIEKIR
jgi:hypothetical protein